jgi:SAM-dependent methyltransferase
MSEDVLNPNYWDGRLAVVEMAGSPLHQAVFRCPLARWEEIVSKHKEILERHIKDDMTILDVGCGWGRLVTLMPRRYGRYVGIDIAPGFIRLAKEKWPDRDFYCMKAEDVGSIVGVRFDLAVLISMRPMLRRNVGDTYWERLELAIRRVCPHILYLEYDPLDEGSLE